MRKTLIIVLLLLLTGALLAACGSKEADESAPVFQIMPDLPGYKVVEGESVLEYITNLAGGASLLAGQPELTVLVEALDGMIDCYQNIGAVNARIFNKESAPLATGAIAIVDHNRMTDPANFFRCATGGSSILTEAPKPCSHNYTLEKDDNKFHIIYVATTEAVCHDFCSNLEGCDKH